MDVRHSADVIAAVFGGAPYQKSLDGSGERDLTAPDNDLDVARVDLRVGGQMLADASRAG